MNDYHHEFNEIKLESSLLKRKINYTTKSNELNHQTLAIEKYKKSSLLSMTKLNELNTKTFKLNQFNIFQKHQKVWFEEQIRLERWKQITSIEISRFFTRLIQLYFKNENQFIDFISVLQDIQVSLDTNSKNVLLEKVYAMNEKSKMLRKNQMVMKFNDKEQLKKQIGQLRSTIEDQLHNDDSLIEKLELELSQFKIPKRVDFRDRWIEFEGDWIQFKDLKYIDMEMNEIHEKDSYYFSNLYNDELQQLKQEYGISNSDPLNGWNKLDHERFVKILDEYSNQTQEKYTLFCERIKMELPYKTSNSISNHYNWYQRQVTFSIKKECLKKSIDDYIEKFIHSTIQNITDEKIQIQEFQVRQQERQNQLEEMQTRHHLLNNWRKNKIQSMIENQTQLQDQIKNQMKREYEKNQNERLRRLEIKNNLIKYHDMLRQQKNEEMKLMHELKLKEAQIKEQERKVNQTRIEYREKNRLNKLKEREMKLQAIMQEKVELEARLDRLRKSVAVNVECDWNRAIQDTVSVLEHKKNTDRPNWYQTVGFSSDQIIKDKRMQLSMQLYKHGLSQSTYGRDVLLSLQPPVQRLDQKSSIRFEHD